MALKKIADGSIVKKYQENPIIAPSPDRPWEAWQTFNPGAILLDDQVHLVYRAIGLDGISRFGYAISRDGLSISSKSPHPVYGQEDQKRVFNIYSFFSGGSFGGAEDPRLTRVGQEERIYMIYHAFGNGLRVTLTSILVSDFLKKRWRWKKPIFISPPGEAHKNWLLFPEKINGKYAILHSLRPKVQVEYLDDLEFKNGAYIKSFYYSEPRKKVWDQWLRGVGAPPIKTQHGWLVFYHAMDEDWSQYKVGALLLDLEDPTKVLYRSKKPILKPEELYETTGYKGGVVYVSGAVVKGDTLFIYYGAADNVICVATANLEAFLKALMKDVEPKIKKNNQLIKKISW